MDIQENEKSDQSAKISSSIWYYMKHFIISKGTSCVTTMKCPSIPGRSVMQFYTPSVTLFGGYQMHDVEIQDTGIRNLEA